MRLRNLVRLIDRRSERLVKTRKSCIRSHLHRFLSNWAKDADLSVGLRCRLRFKPVVYLKRENLTVKPNPGDRTVLLPIPDRVYLGGQLKDAIVADNSGVLQSPSQARSYVATIFEYRHDPDQSNKMTVSTSDGNTFDLQSQHLVFRMRFPPDRLADTEHIEHAFSSLAARIKGGQSDLDISINARSTKIVGGNDTGGISAAEMGIEPGVMSETHSHTNQHATSFLGGFTIDFPSCQGGGIIIMGPH